MTAAERMHRWRHDILYFAEDVFGFSQWDPWEIQALTADDQRIGLKACKGPGKSHKLAIRGWHFLATRKFSKQIAVSITKDNLRDNLWSELAMMLSRPRAKWLREVFEFGAERIRAKEAQDHWWMSARSFAVDADDTQQANTLAGLHAPYVQVLLDEVSDMPMGVLRAAEGIFKSDAKEARLIVSGNPTRSEGPLYEICTTLRSAWKIIEVTGDPDRADRSSRIPIEEARAEIATWGRDDAGVKTNILGEFPTVSVDHLVGPDDIQKAQVRDCAPAAYFDEAIIWGLDCARGGPDKNVLRRRQGPILFSGHKLGEKSGREIANWASLIITNDMEDKRVNPQGRAPDYIFVDVTGGSGQAPLEALQDLGWQHVVPVEFASSADDPRYGNKRSEMYHRLRDWLKTVGCIPGDSQELGKQLCSTKVSIKAPQRRTARYVEDKEEIKKRLGGKSPDDADACALTFYTARPVRRDLDRRFDTRYPVANKCRTEYNPYERTV